MVSENSPVTYLIRHGRTSYSARHFVNGVAALGVPLDDEGVLSAQRFAAQNPWIGTVVSCRTSTFPRTRQTAELLLAPGAVPISADPRLGEVDYGDFEGGPWLTYGDWLLDAGCDGVPPGGTESWRTCVTRMLDGLLGALELPGPRLIVAHGLLSSVVARLLERDGELDGTVLPEVPCLAPRVLTDDRLRDLVAGGHACLDRMKAANGRLVAR